MEYFWIVLPKMGGFLLLVLIGFLASRLGVVKKEALTSISGFLIKIVLPALVISLIWENHTTVFTLFHYGRIVLWQIGAYLLLALTGFLVSRVFKLPGSVRNVFCGCMVGGNFGFLVIPLIMALFAEAGGDKYIPICSVVDTTVVWTLGLLLFVGLSGKQENLWKKVVSTPIFISILIGMALTTFAVPVPALVMDVVTAVGETSYSWGLIYLGCSIGFMEFGGILRYKSVLLLAVCKLVAAPVAVYAIVSHFLPQTESLLLMLITGAPTMTSSSMLARQYNLNEDYASAAVVVTTLLCMATLPLLFLITAL